MYTEDEVRELLEQAYSEGFDSGIEDTLNYMDKNYDMKEFFEEESAFDLEDEYESYNEVMSRYGKDRVRDFASGIKQDEGESDKDFKQRRSNAIRASVAGNAFNDSWGAKKRMESLKEQLKTEKGKAAAEKKYNDFSKSAKRMAKSYDRYNLKSKIDDDKRALRSEINYIKNDYK